MASSECLEKQPRVAVVGIGNLLLRDEGIGVHVAQRLQEVGGGDVEDRANLQVVDGGTCPDILLTLGQLDKLIVVDAAEGGGEPGAVYRLSIEDLQLDTRESNSLHDVDFLDSLRVMETLGIGPKDVVVFGIQAKEIDWGLEPSVELTEKIPEIVGLVLEETRKC